VLYHRNLVTVKQDIASTVREIVAHVVEHYPAVLPHLTGKTRWLAASMKPTEYKTYDYFLQVMRNMVTHVYNNQMGGEFIDIAANLISGQLTQAFRQAWQDEEMDGDLPPYLMGALEQMILDQYDHVDGFYRAIIDARIDETSIEPLLVRASMWANQYNAAYEKAAELIRMENGGNLVWRKGNTENGCSTCDALNGIVMSAREWQELNVHPRGYPNPVLECQGGGPANNCDCTLEATDSRRSPKAYNTVLNIVSK
jgi:hypothetical protein